MIYGASEDALSDQLLGGASKTGEIYLGEPGSTLVHLGTCREIDIQEFISRDHAAQAFLTCYSFTPRVSYKAVWTCSRASDRLLPSPDTWYSAMLTSVSNPLRRCRTSQ